jgi:hypothetical protein
MHPDAVKHELLEMAERYKLEVVVMDMSRAEDIAAWMEDDMGLTVIDRAQSNKFAREDFEAFTDGLRNGTLKHTGDPGLRSHVLHAIARRLPGGAYRFDRPSDLRGNARLQDRRVIDALTAAAMVVQYATRKASRTSVYEERFGLVQHPV